MRSTCLAQPFHPRLRRRLGRVADLDLGPERALPPVLEGDLALDARRRGVGVERVDERPVALADEAAPHLAGARQLAVVGVELLRQQQEAADLRAGEVRFPGEVAV